MDGSDVAILGRGTSPPGSRPASCFLSATGAGDIRGICVALGEAFAVGQLGARRQSRRHDNFDKEKEEEQVSWRRAGVVRN